MGNQVVDASYVEIANPVGYSFHFQFHHLPYSAEEPRIDQLGWPSFLITTNEMDHL